MIKTKPKTTDQRPGWMMWGIPKPLQRAFKIKCIRNGVTMRAALQGLLEGYVHGPKKEEPDGQGGKPGGGAGEGTLRRLEGQRSFPRGYGGLGYPR